MDTTIDGQQKRGMRGRPIGSVAAVPVDMPLENEVYAKDNGCEHSPACLTCPLVACKYDDDRKPSTRRRDATDAKVLPLLESGVSSSEIAARLGVNRRTVYRAQARINRGNGALPE